MQKHRHEFDSVHKCRYIHISTSAHVVCCRKLEICTEKAKRSSRWKRIAPVWLSSCCIVGMESPWMHRVDRKNCWTTPPAERSGFAAFSTPFSTRETLSSVIWAARLLWLSTELFMYWSVNTLNLEGCFTPFYGAVDMYAWYWNRNDLKSLNKFSLIDCPFFGLECLEMH